MKTLLTLVGLRVRQWANDNLGWFRSLVSLFRRRPVPRFNPPAILASSSIFRATVKIGYRGQQYQFRQDYHWDGDGLANANEAAALAVANHLRTPVRLCIGTDATWQGVVVEDLMDLTLPPAFSPGDDGEAEGNGGSVSLPGQLSCLMTKRTLLRGQHGIGHAFIPCVPTGFVTSGVINATGTAAYVTLALALNVPPLATIGGQLLLPCVASFVGRTPETRQVRFQPVFDVRASLEITDRSTRKVGRGQ